MKNLVKEQMNFYKYFSRTGTFYLLILFIFLSSVFYGGFYGATYAEEYTGYFNLLTLVFNSHPYFFSLFLIFLLSTAFIYRMLIKSDFYQLRCNNKEQFFNKLVRTILFQNAILFIIILLVLLSSLHIFADTTYAIGFLEKRHTYDIIYTLFYIFRCFTWIEIFSFFQIWLYSRVSFKAGILVSVLYYVFIYFTDSSIPQGFIIYSPLDISYHIVYFFASAYYSSFLVEILISLFYISLAIFIIKILFKMPINNRKIILFLKHFKNDLKELFTTNKKQIILYFITVIFFFIYFYLNRNEIITILDFQSVLGLTNQEDKLILDIIISIFYQLFFTYFLFRFLTKNIQMQSFYIFLREKPIKYISLKLITSTIGIFFLKLFTYILLYIIFIFISSITINDIIPIFTNDLLFTLCIQMFNVLCFFTYYSFPKTKIILAILLFIELLLFKLSILEFSKFILIITTIILMLAILKIFEKKVCTIYERVEIGG